jgi:NADP-dependent aldehyde dehydrogenase
MLIHVSSFQRKHFPMITQLLGTSFIGYSRSNGTDPCGQGINPATGEKLEPVYKSATPEEIERAMTLAATAFPIYSNLPGKSRAEFLRAIANEIEAVVDDIVERGHLENALADSRLRGETARTTGHCRMFADLIEEGSWVDARIDRADPDRKPTPKPDLRSMLRPLGPVAVFCATNFPVAYSVAGGDSAAALAAGCPVVVIANDSHPGVAEIVAAAVMRAAHKSGMPDGVLSLLYGGGRTVGQAVVKHPVIQAVGFTGSRAGGVALMEIAAKRPQPIPVYAEMSSINPIVILPGALARGEEALAEAFYQSLTNGVGQFCTNPGLVFLPEGKGELFLAKLKSLIEDSPPGVMLNAQIAESFAEATAAVAAVEGVETVACCSVKAGDTQGAPVVFTVSTHRFLKDRSLHQEMFGPATLIVRGSPAEIEAAIPELEGQLTASIHATEEELAANMPLVLALRERCGRLIFNGFPTGVEVCNAIVHGGPYPATSDGRSSSVGTLAIFRFCRPVAWQNFPQAALPPELQDANPLGIRRME